MLFISNIIYEELLCEKKEENSQVVADRTAEQYRFALELVNEGSNRTLQNSLHKTATSINVGNRLLLL